MKTRRNSRALAALALTVSLGLAACGGMDDDTTTDEPAETSPTMSMEEPTDGTFGAGCELIPESGAGSFDGMSADPVATAASNNPLLTTLVAAVMEAELVDTLNSAEALTVFAPTDDAFAKIPEEDLNALLADREMLTTVLTHHVVDGRLSPDQLAGDHDTLAGTSLAVEGSDDMFTVGTAGEPSSVVCGNISTSNATVYVVDTVLMPNS